jgi:hypothetical protein
MMERTAYGIPLRTLRTTAHGLNLCTQNFLKSFEIDDFARECSLTLRCSNATTRLLARSKSATIISTSASFAATASSKKIGLSLQEPGLEIYLVSGYDQGASLE